MTQAFDILKVEAEGVLWIDAVPNLEEAKEQVRELISHTKCGCIIFDQKTASRLLVKFDPWATTRGRG